MSGGNNLAKTFAFIGTVVQCLFIVGFAVTVFRLYQLFLFVMETGSNDAELLAERMIAALVPTMLGLIFGSAGTIISFVTVIVSRYRARWFFWWSLSFSFVYIFSIVGLPFLIYLLIVRKEFFASSGSRVKESASA